MKIKLNLNIFLFLAVFIVTKQIENYVLIMLFALIHEVTHLICGIVMGFKPETLRIMPLGFSIEFKTIVQDYNKKVFKSNIVAVKEIIIALAGPVINLAIAIIGIILNVNINIVYSNLLIFLFNLIPIYPLDGGRILKNILKICYGNRKANEYINLVMNVLLVILTMLSSVLIFIYKNISILAILMILWCLIIKENNRYKIYCKIIDKIRN